jgi:glycosyltransferase involved in cell wall biosynthesis
MPRILFTITRYWPSVGGAEVHTRELIRGLDGRVEPVIAGHWSTNRTDWLLGTTLLAPKTERTYLDEGRPVHLIAPTLHERLQSLPLVAGYYLIQSVAARKLGHVLARHLMARAGRVDLVHNIRGGREPLSVGSLEVARTLGVPFVLTPNHHPRWVGWRYRVYQDLYRRADALIALTEHERSALIQLGALPERVHVTGIGPVLAAEADPLRARQKYGLPGRCVLFLGQKYAYKGTRPLLDSAPLVWRVHPDVSFVFVGPRTEHSKAVFRGMPDARVREIGTVDLQDKTDLLAACDVVCVPSSQESFGGVLVEGWSLRKPVVAGPAPAAAEIITHGADGFFVSAQTPYAIAERLVWLFDHPQRAAEMGESGAQKVKRSFTWERLAAATESLYAALLSRAPATRSGG